MKLILYNTLSAERRIIDLPERGELRIGRPEPGVSAPEVPIQSPLVSRRQAVLRVEPQGPSIEHLGRTDTRIGDRALALGERSRLEPGDEIRIAEYALALVQESREAETPVAQERDREAMALESRIHEQLLARVESEPGEECTDLTSPAARRRIDELLEELVDAALVTAPRALLGHVFRSEVYRKLTLRLCAAGCRSSESSLSGPRAGLDQQLGRALERLAKEIGLSFDACRMREDSAALDASFDRVFEASDLEFSEGVRRHVAKAAIQEHIRAAIYGLGPIQDLMDMESVSEIMVVGRDQIFIEKFGVIADARRAFYSDELLLATIERIVAPLGRRIDRSSPLVDAHLPDGSRVHAVIAPLALDGPCLTIRKFTRQALRIEDLERLGALSRSMSVFLEACVASGRNVIVSGGAGTGKTTLLGALSGFIPEGERIVTIEDTAELRLEKRHVVRLESRPPNAEGRGAIGIGDLVRNALRMRPDRIVVGECRAGEALDMLQAMNTGHDGSMTTLHANSAVDAMRRLETLALASGSSLPPSSVREQIASAVDVVVQLTRLADGRRCVSQLAEVVGIDPRTGELIVEDLFRHVGPEDAGAAPRFAQTGYLPSFTEALLQTGAVQLEDLF